MKRFRHPFDPLKWKWFLNLFGVPRKFELEPGVIYTLKATLGPNSRIRIINDEGDGCFAAAASREYPYRISTPFTMPKENEYVMIQYIGEIGRVGFEIAGVDFSEFA